MLSYDAWIPKHMKMKAPFSAAVCKALLFCLRTSTSPGVTALASSGRSVSFFTLNGPQISKRRRHYWGSFSQRPVGRCFNQYAMKANKRDHALQFGKTQEDILLTDEELLMHEHVRKIVQAGIRAVDPRVAVQSRLKVGDDKKSLMVLDKVGDSDGRYILYEATDYDNILVIAFGKASAPMAMATCEIIRTAFQDHPMKGVVIVKDGHTNQDEVNLMKERYNVKVLEASHPIPDNRGVQASNLILEQVKEASERTLILCCISGGGSALFCSPRPTLTLDDLANTNIALQKSGMDITKMNVIRKKLEVGKGGRLAATAYPATICSLVLSDIIGDPLDLIASGPTVPDDECSWKNLEQIVEQYNLEKLGLPEKVQTIIQNGIIGGEEDTPKHNHPVFSTKRGASLSDVKSPNSTGSSSLCETILIGNNEEAVLAAAEEAGALGYYPVVLVTSFDGEAQHVGRLYVSMALQIRRSIEKNLPYQMLSRLPAALIAGGETTVTLPVDNNGKGGRNQELSLSAALAMKEKKIRNLVLASVGTDGTDGPTDAAGAIVDGGTIDRIESVTNPISSQSSKTTHATTGLHALRNHDAYHFFEKDPLSSNRSDQGGSFSDRRGTLLITGPTGTNVADIAVVLIT